MKRRRGTKGVDEGHHFAGNQSSVQAWLEDFGRSESMKKLSEEVRAEVEGIVVVSAQCLGDDRPISEITRRDVFKLLTLDVPRIVTATNPSGVVDALCSFLTWACKTNRIRRAEVEYACLGARRAAQLAMSDERIWSPGKAIVAHAMAEGLDPSDLVALRAHGIGSGLHPSFVDEFLPPPPVSLGGRWLWLFEERSSGGIRRPRSPAYPTLKPAS